VVDMSADCEAQTSLTSFVEVSGPVQMGFCANRVVCNIPIDSPRVPDGVRPSPAWFRPVRMQSMPSPMQSQAGEHSPVGVFESYQGEDIMSAPPDLTGGSIPKVEQNDMPPDLEAMFNTSDYLNLAGLSPLGSIYPQPANSQAFGNFGGDSFGMGEEIGGVNFDYGVGGFGGETLAREGMDTVSDGLRGSEQQGL
jgi:hypothetical protein